MAAGDVTGFVQSILLDGDARRAGFFDATAVELYLTQHKDNRADLGGGLWTLLMFELWRSQQSGSAQRFRLPLRG